MHFIRNCVDWICWKECCAVDSAKIIAQQIISYPKEQHNKSDFRPRLRTTWIMNSIYPITVGADGYFRWGTGLVGGWPLLHTIHMKIRLLILKILLIWKWFLTRKDSKNRYVSSSPGNSALPVQWPSPTSTWDSSDKLLCILQKINLRRNHEKYHSNSFQIQSTDNFFYLSKIKINDHSLGS